MTHGDGKLQVFDSRLTPNVEVALACRASASLPVIFAPVEIKIGDNPPKLYVDGGVSDNIPFNYFDVDSHHDFVANTKPDQTILFAFGEGYNEENNVIHQALNASPRWHEVEDSKVKLQVIMEDTLALYKNKYGNELKEKASFDPKKLYKIFNKLLEINLKAKSQDKKYPQSLLEHVNKNLEKYLKTITNPDSITSDAFIAKFLSRASLYTPGLKDKLLRDDAVKSPRGGGMTEMPYTNTQTKEEGYQRLKDFALSTVMFPVGNISSTTNVDSEHARKMNAFGYLDTLNYITNHELEKSTFDSKKFYITLVENFEHIYGAVLAGVREKDTFLKELSKLDKSLRGLGKSEETIARQKYQLIKGFVETDMQSSIQSFALSRAVELIDHKITHAQLFKEVYEEAFAHNTIKKSEIIPNQIIRTSEALHSALGGHNMFDLHKKSEKGSRTDKIFEKLQFLAGFKHEASVVVFHLPTSQMPSSSSSHLQKGGLFAQAPLKIKPGKKPEPTPSESKSSPKMGD